MNKFAVLPVLAALATTACQLQPTQPVQQDAAPVVPVQPVPVYSEAEIQNATQKAREMIARYELWELDSSPMMQAYRGLKTNYDKWDDLSEDFADQQQQKAVSLRDELNSIQTEALEPSLALSIELLKYDLDQSIHYYPFRYHNYPVNSLFGLHTEVPSFLINIHQIHDIKDAQNYIARVEGVAELFDQLIEQLEIRERKGIIPPNFVFEKTISTIENFLTGYPLQELQSVKTDQVLHPVWENFIQKLNELQLYKSSETVLEQKMKRAMQNKFKPAYERLLAYLQTLQNKSSLTTGFHQFDQGDEYYRLRLKQITTTQMNAEQIHALGLQKVAEIHGKIQQLLPALGETSLEALFERTRTDRSLYYVDGKTALNDSKQYIQKANEQLGKIFKGIPNLPMQVKPVEAFREKSAPVAFYQSPSDDGSRPGTYYMNFSKLNEMPKFQFEALAYHETIPGHHLQIIYALQAENLPQFRRYAHYTAYSEGWALYAESLGHELNGYQDPWNQYGQLLMELWRACRLVLDTGLHEKGWTLEMALDYRLKNTPFSKQDSINAIQRYLVMPGQATAYMVGQIRFQSLRQKAEQRLGKRFDLGRFHEFILRLGPLPLDLLETQLDQWLQSQAPAA